MRNTDSVKRTRGISKTGKGFIISPSFTGVAKKGSRAMVTAIRLGQKVYRNCKDGVSERYTVVRMLGNTCLAESDTYEEEILITDKDLSDRTITTFPLFHCNDWYMPELADYSLN